MSIAGNVEAESATDPRALVGNAYDRLRSAHNRRGGLTYEQRMEYLARLADVVRDRQDEICQTIDDDYGHRAHQETLIAEVFVIINQCKYIRKHLKDWMKPRRRSVSMLFQPGRAEVVYQPLGVVGVIAPWNYPVQLALGPLAIAIAAGNRVLLKPSEITPRTADLVANLVASVFPEDVATVVTGGTDVGIAFSQQPFDHLLFTGATSIGRHIMRAAAENLTPVTLELGGKSPAIIHRSYPLAKAIERIAAGTCFNAGQTCIAPDYVLLPEGLEDRFVERFHKQVAEHYPTIEHNPDFSSVVNRRHFERLTHYLDDAREKGALVDVVNPGGQEPDAGTLKLAPTLVMGVTEDMLIMQEEVFGPLLPVMTYKHLDDAIAYVNARPRPLALYYFDHDQRRVQDVLKRTVSGGACINETMIHFAVDDLPFGGVGHSGMGAYHAREGFETFSHKKGIFYQSRFNTIGLLSPPFGKRINKMLELIIGKPRRR